MAVRPMAGRFSPQPDLARRRPSCVSRHRCDGRGLRRGRHGGAMLGGQIDRTPISAAVAAGRRRHSMARRFLSRTRLASGVRNRGAECDHHSAAAVAVRVRASPPPGGRPQSGEGRRIRAGGRIEPGLHAGSRRSSRVGVSSAAGRHGQRGLEDVLSGWVMAVDAVASARSWSRRGRALPRSCRRAPPRCLC